VPLAVTAEALIAQDRQHLRVERRTLRRGSARGGGDGTLHPRPEKRINWITGRMIRIRHSRTGMLSHPLPGQLVAMLPERVLRRRRAPAV